MTEVTNVIIDKDFSLVYPINATDSEKAAVEAITNAINRLGITLTIQDDSSPESENEILIGRTCRSASQAAFIHMSDGDFTLSVSQSGQGGCKIVLAATDADGIELGAGYFVFTYLNQTNAGTLPSDLNFTHKRTDIKLNGVAVSDYTVVYAQEGTDGDKDIQAAKYVDTVKEFVKLLEKATGSRINAISDTEKTPDNARLILFGHTALSDDTSLCQSELTTFSSFNAYAAKLLDNGYLALAGSNACSALAAGEAAIYAMLEAHGELSTLNRSGKKDLIHVACVGDSITYGTNSSDPSMHNYPVYLQRMLGYGYYVEKYGAPGHSLIETDITSFLKHTYFPQSVNTMPDVVIVMLGTNDCRTQKWEDSAYKDWNDPARKEAFLASGQKLVDAYRNQNADVQIIFATCPTVPQDAWLGTDWTDRIKQYGNPGIQQIASANNCPVIDIFTYSTQHLEMFDDGDGLHPQNEKYAVLAQGVYELSKDIIKK